METRRLACSPPGGFHRSAGREPTVWALAADAPPGPTLSNPFRVPLKSDSRASIGPLRRLLALPGLPCGAGLPESNRSAALPGLQSAPTSTSSRRVLPACSRSAIFTHGSVEVICASSTPCPITVTRLRVPMGSLFGVTPETSSGRASVSSAPSMVRPEILTASPPGAISSSCMEPEVVSMGTRTSTSSMVADADTTRSTVTSAPRARAEATDPRPAPWNAIVVVRPASSGDSEAACTRILPSLVAAGAPGSERTTNSRPRSPRSIGRTDPSLATTSYVSSPGDTLPGTLTETLAGPAAALTGPSTVTRPSAKRTTSPLETPDQARGSSTVPPASTAVASTLAWAGDAAISAPHMIETDMAAANPTRAKA